MIAAVGRGDAHAHRHAARLCAMRRTIAMSRLSVAVPPSLAAMFPAVAPCADMSRLSVALLPSLAAIVPADAERFDMSRLSIELSVVD